jgi:hypothetical protein
LVVTAFAGVATVFVVLTEAGMLATGVAVVVVVVVDVAPTEPVLDAVTLESALGSDTEMPAVLLKSSVTEVLDLLVGADSVAADGRIDCSADVVAMGAVTDATVVVRRALIGAAGISTLTDVLLIGGDGGAEVEVACAPPMPGG